MISRALSIALPAVLALATLACGGEARAETRCGTKALYGKTYVLYSHGVPCADVKRITSAKCDSFGEPWFCFSSHAPGPPLYWAKDAERFKEDFSAWIETRRPPCSRSKVTAADWQRANAQAGDAFPTEMQLLADDLLRCKQLRGKTRAAITKLLGTPHESDKTYMSWSLGSERSYMQIDSEYLNIDFDRTGTVKSASIDQG